MKIQFSHSRGFTLIELMIVIAIIGILMTMSLFPFGSYMDRSALRQAKDELTQEWILAHKAVRNGIQFESDDETTAIDEGKHASVLFAFEPKSTTIEISLLDDGDPTHWNDTNNKKHYKTITFDRNIEFLSFSGASNSSSTLHYLITPPYATGAFYQDTTLLSEDDMTVTIGYPGADAISGRQKQIYLRPYLQ